MARMARQAAVANNVLQLVTTHPNTAVRDAARACVDFLARAEMEDPRGYVRGSVVIDEVRQTTGKSPYDAFNRLTALGVVEQQPNARDASLAGPDNWRLTEVGLSLVQQLAEARSREEDQARAKSARTTPPRDDDAPAVAAPRWREPRSKPGPKPKTPKTPTETPAE